MLRAVSSFYIESQALEILSLTRRDVFKCFRTRSWSSQAPRSQTVVTSAGGEAPPPAPPPPPLPPPSPSTPPPPRLAWHLAATALAVTASLGGFYYYRKLTDDQPAPAAVTPDSGAVLPEEQTPVSPIPSSGEEFPSHVQFLLVGAGTASFAAMRAIRAARPDAQVLLVGEEMELPYMRPPLSKELWREPDLAERAAQPDALTFRQWNGRRRSVTYEPAAFYVPVAQLAAGASGAAVARGWRVRRLDAARREAQLEAPGRAPVLLSFDKALVATGVRARRCPALAEAAAAGRSLALRGVRDAGRLARELESAERVAVLGGGFLAAELSAALAERLRGRGRVLQLFREAAPLAAVLPPYLAREAARRLRASGVELLAGAELQGAELRGRGLQLRLASGERVAADLVVECVGAEVDEALARASRLETHAALGGLLVNAELQARAHVYAAGDVACFYDELLGRRRLEHHDHAVVSGRLAGENMAALAPPKHYTHQSMFWSDLGPQLGYEAIGIIDSRLPTVGVFSANAVTTESKALEAGVSEESAEPKEEDETSLTRPAMTVSHEATPAAAVPVAAASGAAAPDAEASCYERGVVFYLREKRVVGILLWNLFNRMHVARQVLAQGEFEDLFEVAKLFSLHEEE